MAGGGDGSDRAGASAGGGAGAGEAGRTGKGDRTGGGFAPAGPSATTTFSVRPGWDEGAASAGGAEPLARGGRAVRGRTTPMARPARQAAASAPIEAARSGLRRGRGRAISTQSSAAAGAPAPSGAERGPITADSSASTCLESWSADIGHPGTRNGRQHRRPHLNSG